MCIPPASSKMIIAHGAAVSRFYRFVLEFNLSCIVYCVFPPPFHFMTPHQPVSKTLVAPRCLSSRAAFPHPIELPVKATATE
jgi:hypothetical protein